MSKGFLITRPNHELVTRYLYAWSEDVVTMAHSKGMGVYDLKAEKANRKEFESYMEEHNPEFIMLNGHGNADEITGYQNEPLLDASSEVRGSVIYARSCDAGHSLGGQLVNNGLRCFLGYKRKFVFVYNSEKVTKPLEDQIAGLFLEPSNLIPTTLLKHNSAQEAHNRSRKAMHKNFRKMMASSATFEERYAAKFLWANINSQTLIGDSGATI